MVKLLKKCSSRADFLLQHILQEIMHTIDFALEINANASKFSGIYTLPELVSICVQVVFHHWLDI